KDDRPGGSEPGDQRADVPPLAKSIRRDEGGGSKRAEGGWGREPRIEEGGVSEAVEGVGGRERAIEEAVGGGGSGQGDLEGSLGGKLLSPARRRQAVEHVRENQDVSQRRACQGLGQPRSTQRYQLREDSQEEQRLVARMHALAAQYPRYGYRMITAKLRQEGWSVNRKRIYRLWRREGLKVPKKTVKKRRLGHSGNSCVRRKAEHKDHVWAWDFIHDRTATGRPLKWLAITDEYTRECLALEVDRSITAER